MATQQVEFLPTDHGQLRYQWRPGSGIGFVFIHEMGGSLDSWQAVWDLLPGDATALRYDFCVGSEVPRDGVASVEQRVAELAHLLDRIGIAGPLFLVGDAVGAAIALGFAARYPARVEHVLALAPACGVHPDRVAATRQKAKEIRDDGSLRGFMPLVDLAWPPACRRDDGRFACYVKSLQGVDPADVADTLDMLADMWFDAVLPQVSAPTTLVGGQHDGLRPPAEISRLANLIPAAQVRIVDAGHFIHIERPELVVEMLNDCRSLPHGAHGADNDNIGERG